MAQYDHNGIFIKRRRFTSEGSSSNTISIHQIKKLSSHTKQNGVNTISIHGSPKMLVVPCIANLQNRLHILTFQGSAMVYQVSAFIQQLCMKVNDQQNQIQPSLLKHLFTGRKQLLLSRSIKLANVTRKQTKLSFCFPNRWLIWVIC